MCKCDVYDTKPGISLKRSSLQKPKLLQRMSIETCVIGLSINCISGRPKVTFGLLFPGSRFDLSRHAEIARNF